MTTPTNDVTYVDNTLLCSVARCDTQAVFRHVLDLDSTETRAVLRSGQDLHAAVADYLVSGDRHVGLASFDSAYRAWADDHVPTGDRLSWENCRRVLDRWLRTHPVDRFPLTVDPALVEVGFAYPLTDDGSIVFVGRLDLIGQGRDDGWWYVMDHKFTGRITETWQQQWALDSQVSGYVWAAQHHLGRRVVGMMINGVELSKLPSDPVRRCKKHAVTYAECGPLHALSDLRVIQRTPDQLELWRQGAIALARRFLALRAQYPTLESMDANLLMQGMWSHNCPWCPFRDACATGRRPEIVRNLYTVSPWRPYERLTGTKEPS